MSDARQVNVFRGAVTLLAHGDKDFFGISDTDMAVAINVADRLWDTVADTIRDQPHGPVSKAA